MEIKDELEAQSIVAVLRNQLNEEKTADPWIYFKGRGRAPLSSKFNVLIYKNSKGCFKVVTTDEHTLEILVSGEKCAEKRRVRVDIDDAGIGCPIGGVLIGAYHHGKGLFLYEEIPVVFFQPPDFSQKLYVNEAERISLQLIEKLACDPKESVVYICTGYIHQRTKEALRRIGFEVQVTEIEPPLQDLLEDALKQYLKERFNFAGFYDPKIDNPVSGFAQAMHWLKENPERMRFAKTGWKFFSFAEN